MSRAAPRRSWTKTRRCLRRALDRTASPSTCRAQGNFFGGTTAAFIEGVVRHDYDDTLLGFVDYAASVPSADLSLTAAFVTDPAFVGQQLTLLIKVTNFGTDSAVGVHLDVDVPVGSTFVSVATSQGTGGESAGVVGVDIGTMAAVRP